jgi:hypothetical protein
MKKLILICGLLTSSFSFGADWRLIATASDDTRTYIDADTFKYQVNDNSVSIWVKKDNFRTQLSNGFTVEVKHFDKYFCGSSKVSTMSSVAYDTKGNVLETSNINEGLHNIVPESTGESVYNYVCKNPKKGLEPQLHDFDSVKDYTDALKKFTGLDYSKIDEKKYGKSPDFNDFESIDEYSKALAKYQKKFLDDVKKKTP